jgi:hypothetical protein
MKKYIVALLLVTSFNGYCQLKTGIEFGVLISGSKDNKEIIPLSAWSSFLNLGYKFKRLNILSGIGYSSYQCENKTVTYISDNNGNKLMTKEYTGYYSANYLTIPLSLEYDFMYDKTITPFVGVGVSNSIKASSGFGSTDYRYVKNESIKTSDLFYSIFTSVGLKAKIGTKFEALIKSRYQHNTSNVFYSKKESLSFNGISFNIGLNYIF